MAHTSLGEQLLKQFGADCDEVATVAKGAKLEGRNMSMFLSPKIPNNLQKKQNTEGEPLCLS